MYALLNPQDGKEPAYQAIASREDAPTGAVVVGEIPPGSVWDSASGALRPKRGAEELAGIKAAKRAELGAAFARACEADFPGGPWAALGVLASSPQDARVTSLRGRTAALQTKTRAVDQATTGAEVGAVTW